MLDPRFPPYTPGSRSFHEFERDGELQLLTAEARRTLDALAAAAPARVASGRSTKREAEAVIFLWLAIAQDLEATALPPDEIDARCRALRAEHGIAWADKVAALRGEIEARRIRYPADVDRGRLTRDQARQQLERLEAIHDLYWRHGYAFDRGRAELAAFSDGITDYDIELNGAAVVAPAREHAA